MAARAQRSIAGASTRRMRSRRLARGAAAVVLALAALVSTGASPWPRTYTTDQLVVQFYRLPTETELGVFQAKYRLGLDHRLSDEPVYLFKILDRLDAKLKQPFVAEDPLVCRVGLRGGSFSATTPGQPFGRCEGDEVRTPWTPPPASAAPPAPSPLPASFTAPVSSPPGDSPPTSDQPWTVGMGVLGILGVLVAGVFVGRWLLGR